MGSKGELKMKTDISNDLLVGAKGWTLKYDTALYPTNIDSSPTFCLNNYRNRHGVNTSKLITLYNSTFRNNPQKSGIHDLKMTLRS